jgi:hypothetical protein
MITMLLALLCMSLIVNLAFAVLIYKLARELHNCNDLLDLN